MSQDDQPGIMDMVAKQWSQKRKPVFFLCIQTHLANAPAVTTYGKVVLPSKTFIFLDKLGNDLQLCHFFIVVCIPI